MDNKKIYMSIGRCEGNLKPYPISKSYEKFISTYKILSKENKVILWEDDFLHHENKNNRYSRAIEFIYNEMEINKKTSE